MLHFTQVTHCDLVVGYVSSEIWYVFIVFVTSACLLVVGFDSLDFDLVPLGEFFTGSAPIVFLFETILIKMVDERKI